MVFSSGQMEDATEVSGSQVFNMEKEFTLLLMETKKKENGKMENESNG